MAGWTIRVVVASLLMASSALAQATNDPFYTPIPAADGVITANVVEFASLPDVDGQPARMMLLVDEPGTGQLFVNDMRGLLYNVSHDGRVVTRYLDLTAPTWGLSIQARGNERGFQSFAFHPQFNQPGTPGFGKLYTYLDTTNTTPTPDFVSGGGSDAHDTILLEWTAENPGAITYDGGPPRELLRFEQPFGNHNGGQVGFDPLLSPGDPDFGLLYIGVADGGSGGDPLDLAQNLGRAFGKILRVDPFGSDSANGKYGLPADNPFANGDASTLPEIYAYGVRNPQRFGWDPTTGNMFLADIGQNIVEEISLVTRGANLGWNDWEGSYRFISRREVSLIDARGEAGLNYPVAEYGQLDPLLQRSSAATGVVVYRDDAIPALTNLLLFGDNPSGEVFAIQADQLPAGGQDAIRRVLFIFQDDEMSKTLLQLIQEKNRGQGRSPATRADLRFGTGPEGQIFLLNKRDGVIRLLVPWQAAEQRQHAGFGLQASGAPVSPSPPGEVWGRAEGTLEVRVLARASGGCIDGSHLQHRRIGRVGLRGCRAGAGSRPSRGTAQHAVGGDPRPAGSVCVSSASGRAGWAEDPVCRSPRRRGAQPADGQRRGQRDVGRRRDRPGAACLSPSHSRNR